MFLINHAQKWIPFTAYKISKSLLVIIIIKSWVQRGQGRGGNGLFAMACRLWTRCLFAGAIIRMTANIVAAVKALTVGVNLRALIMQVESRIWRRLCETIFLLTSCVSHLAQEKTIRFKDKTTHEWLRLFSNSLRLFFYFIKLRLRWKIYIELNKTQKT